MSVDRKIYFGIYVDVLDLVDDIYSDELLPYIEGWEDVDFDMVYDGMCGDYAYFGKTFASIDDYDDNNIILEDGYDKYYSEIYEKLDELGIELGDRRLRLMVFNHYS